MNGLAALTIKEAAVASGHGAGLLPAIAPSALDGFAVGALLSALCVLLVMVPRHFSRRAPKAHPAAPAVTSPFADESAEMVIGYPVRASSGQLPERSFPPPATTSSRTEVKSVGRRSKHRLTDAERLDRPERQDRLPEARRGAGRHAAPPIGSGGRMGSKRALHPMAARD